jgi:hypothetical protein
MLLIFFLNFQLFPTVLSSFFDWNIHSALLYRIHYFCNSVCVSSFSLFVKNSWRFSTFLFWFLSIRSLALAFFYFIGWRARSFELLLSSKKKQSRERKRTWSPILYCNGLLPNIAVWLDELKKRDEQNGWTDRQADRIDNLCFKVRNRKRDEKSFCFQYTNSENERVR